MSDKIIQLNEGAIKQELKELVRHSVEETLNNFLIKKQQSLLMQVVMNGQKDDRAIDRVIMKEI